MEYMINPVKMGGLVKEINGTEVKVHLHGRLGVITIPERLIIHREPLVPGHEAEFYFSYIQVNEHPYDYDSSDMTTAHEPAPCFLGGTIIEVNDTAARIAVMDDLGTIAVPRRWMFTSVPLAEGQTVEFYFSPMKIIGRRDIPKESI